MTWIICEGLDRTGKTTVADKYKSQGFEVVHLLAPSKKYSQPGYSGPSYLDEMLELYISKSGVDVFWDRTVYGELIWSQIYGRNPQLSEEDFEVLREIEAQNYSEYILMYDPSIENNWTRCVQNKEPLTKSQFIQANRLYNQIIAVKYGFIKRTLLDYVSLAQEQNSEPVLDKQQEPEKELKQVTEFKTQIEKKPIQEVSLEQRRLLQANAINDVLSSRIIKKKGDHYNVVEDKIRSFLNNELSTLIGINNVNSTEFSQDEIIFLKTLIKQAHKKIK